MDRFAGTTASDSLERAAQVGREAFGPSWTPDGVGIAPGRIELLGNHLDYNGGPVLAAAIDRFMVVFAAEQSGTEANVDVIAADIDEHNRATLHATELAGWRNSASPPHSLDY